MTTLLERVVAEVLPETILPATTLIELNVGLEVQVGACPTDPVPVDWRYIGTVVVFGFNSRVVEGAD